MDFQISPGLSSLLPRRTTTGINETNAKPSAWPQKCLNQQSSINLSSPQPSNPSHFVYQASFANHPVYLMVKQLLSQAWSQKPPIPAKTHLHVNHIIGSFLHRSKKFVDLRLCNFVLFLSKMFAPNLLPSGGNLST